MGRKTVVIIVSAVLLVAAIAVAGAYAYDRSQEGKIAEGVTIEGIDVGGMDADEAEAKVRRELLAPLDKPLKATYRDQKWKLPGEKLKVRADIEGAVDQAVEVSREGDLPTRIGRYLGGDELEVGISAHVDYSQSAINKFVRHIADELNRKPQDASVDPSAETLEVVASHPGRKLRDVRPIRSCTARTAVRRYAGPCRGAGARAGAIPRLQRIAGRHAQVHSCPARGSRRRAPASR